MFVVASSTEFTAGTPSLANMVAPLIAPTTQQQPFSEAGEFYPNYQYQYFTSSNGEYNSYFITQSNASLQKQFEIIKEQIWCHSFYFTGSTYYYQPVSTASSTNFKSEQC